MSDTPETNKAPLANVHPLLFVAMSLLVVFFLYQITSAVLVTMFVGLDMNFDAENIEMIRLITTFAQFMFLLIPSIILTMLRGDTIKAGFKLNKPPFKVVIISLIAIVIIQPIMQAYLVLQNKVIFALPFGTEYIQSLKDFFDLLESTTLNLVSAHSIPELLIVVFAIAVTPAICEEGLFRGLVFKNMIQFSSPARAVAVTGIIFALFHFHPFNLVPLILIGIFLTYITFVSNSIFPAVICHFVNNFLAVISVYIYGKENFNDFNISTEETLILVGVGIASAVIFYFLMKLLAKEHVKRIQKQFENLHV